MYHQVLELSIYIGEYLLEQAKIGFEWQLLGTGK